MKPLRAPFAAAAVGAFGLWHALRWTQPFEDSFITYRYAENLAQGRGLVFNPGEVVEGFTSFAWTVALAALRALGLPLQPVSQALSVLAGLVLLALTAALARRWTARPDAVAVPSLAALLVAASGTWAYYSGTGMETSLFSSLLYGALLVLSTPGPRRAVLGGALLALAAMVRPEGAGYAGLLGAVLLLARDDRRDGAALSGAFAALFVPYFAWRWHHFGFPLPNTFYAKASPSRFLWLTGLSQVESFLTVHLFWLAAPALFALLRAQPSRGWRLAAITVLGAFVNNIVVGRDTFPCDRFLLPALPAGAVALAAALSLVRERASLRWPSRGPLLRALAGGWGLALAAWWCAEPLLPHRTFSYAQSLSAWTRAQHLHRFARDYFLVGAWLRRHVPPGTLLATNAAGIVPYVSGLPTLDMLGLNDVHIAHLPVTLGRGTPGHEKSDPRYVLSRRPGVVLLGLPLASSQPVPPEQLDAFLGRWFDALPGDRVLYRSRAFRREYVPLGVRLAEGRFLVLFLRRGLELVP